MITETDKRFLYRHSTYTHLVHHPMRVSMFSLILFMCPIRSVSPHPFSLPDSFWTFTFDLELL